MRQHAISVYFDRRTNERDFRIVPALSCIVQLRGKTKVKEDVVVKTTYRSIESFN